MSTTVRQPSRRRAAARACLAAASLAAVLGGAALGGAAFGGSGVAVAAVGFEPMDGLRRAAERALRSRVAETQPDSDPAALRIEVGELDARLRLARCAGAPEAALPPGATLRHRTVVRVSCAGPRPWSVLLPATLEVDAEVLVLERALPRGAQPRETDVRVVRRRLPGLASGYLSPPVDLAAWRLRRPLDAGAALARDALEPAPVVRRGQTVTLVSRAGGIDVRASGEALADAAPGQRVRIRNLASLKIVDGLADESGTVRVSP